MLRCSTAIRRRLRVSLGVALLPLLALVAIVGGSPAPGPVLASSNSNGYLLVAKGGDIFNFGDAKFQGSAADLPLNSVLRGIAARPAHDGYWTVAADGGVFAFGQAPFLGSVGGVPLNRPVWGMASTPTGAGYWLVATDGGIFSFGDAGFFGSTGGMRLNMPILGMAPTPSGKGYWLVAKDGGVFAFGDAVFHGSTGNLTLKSPIVGIAATPSGNGYWLVAADGGIFAMGDARFFGSAAPFHPAAVVGMAVTSSGNGYWLAAADGGVFSFGDAAALGSAANLHLTSPIIGIAATGVLNEAPTVAVSGSQTVVTNSRTVTVSGTGTDSDGRVRVIQTSSDAAPFTTDGVACSGCDGADATWSFTSGSLTEGPHHLGFRAIDDDGAASSSTSITVIVDLTVPTVAVNGGPGSGSVSADASPTFSGTAADTGSGVKKVTVSVDGGAATNATCGSCGSADSPSWTWTPSHALADGSHTFQFRSVDAAGNVSASASRTLTVDTAVPAAPVVDAFAAVNGAGAGSVSFSGTAQPDATVTVSVSDGGNVRTVTGSTTADGSGHWTVTGLALTGLADGTISVSATATDVAGNVSPAGTQSGSKDTVAPAAPVVNAFATINAAGASSAPFSGTAEANSTVNLVVSDAGNVHSVAGSPTADGSGHWTVSVNVSGLDDGTISVSATASDAAGNTGPAGTRSGSKDTAAPAAPVVNAFAAVNAAGAGSVSFSGTAEASSTVNVSVSDAGNVHTVTGSTTADGSGHWSVSGLDVSGLDDGTISASATATDAAGNVSSAGTQTGVKDTLAPVAPTIDVFADIDIFTVGSMSFSGTAEANSTVDISVSDGLVPVTTSTTADASGNWSVSGLDLSSLATGPVTVSATATDAAGNTSSAGTQSGLKLV